MVFLDKRSIAQAGLEYLMTYGWALVLIVTVVSVLFFVFSDLSSNVVFSSSKPTKILLRSGNVSGTNAEIQLQNITGGKIIIEDINGFGDNCKINGAPLPVEGLAIPPSGEIKVKCENCGSRELSEPLVIEYKDYSNTSRSVTISSTGTASSAETGGGSEQIVVDDKVSVSFGLVAYDRGTGEFSMQATITNTSSTVISQPLWFVVKSISDSNVTLANPDGNTSEGYPYVDFSENAGDGKLDPDENAAFRIGFNNPLRLRFTFEHSVLGVPE